MAEIVLTNLHKVYGHVVAVKDINLAINDREFVVLVGPSGCGKSTTLRMVAGLEEISAGTIAIGGRVVNHLQPKDRDIAMVFQNYALYRHMTVRDNLAFGLRNRRVPAHEIAAAISRAARILSIEPLLDRRPHQLSGGQQQRVALGRCIVRNPKVFLFDEPLSNLDAQLPAQMRLELKELRLRFPDLASRIGRSVSVGVRPQHIRLGTPVGDNQVGLKGTVMVTEQLGDEQLLAVRFGDAEIRIAGVDPDLTLATGSQIEAAVATDNLHFFEEAEESH